MLSVLGRKGTSLKGDLSFAISVSQTKFARLLLITPLYWQESLRRILKLRIMTLLNASHVCPWPCLESCRLYRYLLLPSDVLCNPVLMNYSYSKVFHGTLSSLARFRILFDTVQCLCVVSITVSHSVSSLPAPRFYLNLNFLLLHFRPDPMPCPARHLNNYCASLIWRSSCAQ